MTYRIETKSSEGTYRLVNNLTDEPLLIFKGGVGDSNQYTLVGNASDVGVVIHITETYGHTESELLQLMTEGNVLDKLEIHGYPKWTSGLVNSHLHLGDSLLGTISTNPIKGGSKFTLESGKRYYLMCPFTSPAISMGLFNDFTEQNLITQVTLH